MALGPPKIQAALTYVPTITEINTDVSADELAIEIVTTYSGNQAAKIISAFIAEVSKPRNSPAYKQGELIVTIVGVGSLTATINSMGELVLTGDQVELDKYSINDLGQLTYTF